MRKNITKLVSIKNGFLSWFSSQQNLKKWNLKQLPFYLFYILVGFFFGNIFGIISKENSLKIIISLIILFFELINYLKFESQYFQKNIVENITILLILNAVKRGFLIGIFVEAFKVGS